MGGWGVKDLWINFHRLQTLAEEACVEDDSLGGGAEWCRRDEMR